MSFGPPDVLSDRIWGIDANHAPLVDDDRNQSKMLTQFGADVVDAVDGMNSFLSSAAETLGTTEAGLRLLISLFLGYPVAIIHRSVVSSHHPVIQNAYFTACGLLIGIFNYGWQVSHCLACVAVQYATLLWCGKSAASPAFSMLFQMAYLLFGYWTTATGEDYDISWTLPHCVLTLRLIGVAFDYYDGQKDPSELSKDQKLIALRRCPSLLELCGHALFPASFMVGPQFPMKRYKFLIKGDLRKIRDKDGKELSPPVVLALARFGLGVLYTGLYVFGSAYFPVSYGYSDDLLNRPLWQRLFLIAVWAKVNIMKYLGCWLLTEGACILSGLSFNGFDKEGDPRWDGCRNIHISIYETATEYQHMITCFNTNTNAWVANYVYKRLKFLNRKHVSHMAAMAFLAVWHGLHFAYYVTFFNEYIIISRERDFYDMLDKSPVYKRWFSKTWVKFTILPFKVMWVLSGLSYAVVPFLILSTRNWWLLYSSLYFHIHAVFLAYPFVKPTLKKWLQVPDEPSDMRKKVE